MIYTLENHELKHAVEEMLFHLLPTETLTRVETVEQRTEPYCRSILTEENGEAAARAIVCMDGAVHEAEKRASVTGLATLDYKRTITELVKTTVYDAVVPFLPQAPVWGSLTGVRPAKLARGMIERGMTRGEAAVELREHFHVSPERTALTIRCSRNRDGDGQDHRGERYFAVCRYSVLSVEVLLLLVRIGNHGAVR